MNKEIKTKLVKQYKEMRAVFPSLYDQQWVEDAADKGWKDVVENLDKAQPGFKKLMDERTMNIFAVVYYCAFENALNTFFKQCLEDSLTTVDMALHDHQKATVEIKTKGGEGEEN